MYVIEMNNYIYLVPFVEDIKDKIFLKTIFPHRKATKNILSRRVMAYDKKKTSYF